MTIVVNSDDPTPPYEQIRSSLAAEITSGRIPAGHRLPTVRQLAADLHIAVGTAARAYRELEEAGLVATRRSQGTTVRENQVVEPNLAEAARNFVLAIRHEHISLVEVTEAVERAWAN